MHQHSTPEPSPVTQKSHPRRTIVLAILITGILAMAARSLLQQLEPDDGFPDLSSFESLPAAIDALQNEKLSRQRRLIASSAVTEYGADAVPELRRLLQSSSISTRTFALMALRELGSKAEPSLPELTALVDRATPEELTPLASTLARFAPGEEPTIQALRNCATSDNVVDQTTALTLLPAAGHGQRSVLRLLLTNADHIVRIQVIEKLRDQEPIAATLVKELEELLYDQRAATSSAAYWTLGATDNLSDAALGRLLDDPDGPNYSSALYSLRERPGLAETRYDEFLSVLQDAQQSSSVRLAALECLGSVWPDDWLPCEHATDWILDEADASPGEGWGIVTRIHSAHGIHDAGSVAERIASLRQNASAGSVLPLTKQRITADLMADITRIPQLRVLVFRECEIDEDALGLLEGLTALRILSLEVCRLTDDHLLKLPTLSSLTHLRLSEYRKETPSGRGVIVQPYERITNDGMRGIARQSALQALMLENIGVNDDSLVCLSELPDLRYFRHHGPYRGLSTGALSQLKLLRRLEAGLRHGSDLRYISRMSELRELHIQGDDITDAGLPWLGKLTKLRLLRIRSDNVTVVGLQHLQTLLPECTIEAY
jgi:HEAT repeat protein